MERVRKVVAAFGEEHVERLTGVSRSQLRYWDSIHFYTPSYAEQDRHLPFSRVYSFKDIVALRVLNMLRNLYHVSLQHLRSVSKKLTHSMRDDEKWTGIRLYVANKKVVWQQPGEATPREVLSGQHTPEIVLLVVANELRRDVELLNKREPKQEGVVVRSRFVNHNAPVLSGTRIPVNAIKRFAAAGYKVAQILREYPDLTEKDVQAALAYEPRAAA